MSTPEIESRYRLGGPLRFDGVGTLHCAEDLQTGARAATRWLPLDASTALALKNIEDLPKHPKLSSVQMIARMGERAFVATDFPIGKLLTPNVAQEADYQALTKIGAQIAAALTVLHQQDLPHGELSVDSVLIADDGQAYLWDVPWVLVNRYSDRRSESRTIAQVVRMGPYLSPERAMGKKPSMLADVYGLGAVLCIAGGAPLPESQSTLETLHLVASGEWRPLVPEGFAGPVRMLLGMMISPEPEKRPTADAVAQALEALSIFSNDPSMAKADDIIRDSMMTDPAAALPVLELQLEEVLTDPAVVIHSAETVAVPLEGNAETKPRLPEYSPIEKVWFEDSQVTVPIDANVFGRKVKAEVEVDPFDALIATRAQDPRRASKEVPGGMPTVPYRLPRRPSESAVRAAATPKRAAAMEAPIEVDDEKTLPVTRRTLTPAPSPSPAPMRSFFERVVTWLTSFRTVA